MVKMKKTADALGPARGVHLVEHGAALQDQDQLEDQGHDGHPEGEEVPSAGHQVVHVRRLQALSQRTSRCTSPTRNGSPTNSSTPACALARASWSRALSQPRTWCLQM